MVHSEAIISEARSWLGTRWRHQASLKGVGCDCIGLIAGVAASVKAYGSEEFYRDSEVRGYGRSPNSRMLLAACNRYLDGIPVNEARVGDILLMRIKTDPQHFAFLSRRHPDYMIHAYAQARKVVENRINEVWHLRISHVWRLREAEDR